MSQSYLEDNQAVARWRDLYSQAKLEAQSLEGELTAARSALRWALAELGYPGDFGTPLEMQDACNKALEVTMLTARAPRE